MGFRTLYVQVTQNIRRPDLRPTKHVERARTALLRSAARSCPNLPLDALRPTRPSQQTALDPEVPMLEAFVSEFFVGALYGERRARFWMFSHQATYTPSHSVDLTVAQSVVGVSSTFTSLLILLQACSTSYCCRHDRCRRLPLSESLYCRQHHQTGVGQSIHVFLSAGNGRI